MKVLFVCLGNICRSPMAEYYFRHIVNREGLGDKISVDSAGTSNEEEGNPIYPLAKRMLATKGIGCKDKRARMMIADDYDTSDYIIAMDNSNMQFAVKFFGGDKQHKVSLLMDHVDPDDKANYHRDVSDPWYTRRFDKAFDDIVLGCNGLLRDIKKSLEEQKEE